MKKALTIALSISLLLNVYLIFFDKDITISNHPEDSSNEVDNTVEDNQNNDNTNSNEVNILLYESQRNIWGADPGLGVSVLHELGYTGKGAIIAYADGKMLVDKHDEFSEADVVYENFPDRFFSNEWHGNGVLSLLLGKNIGTAPDVKCYYFGYEPNNGIENDQMPIADVIREVMRVNDTLTENEKIRMLGFSNNIEDVGPDAINNDEAIKATEEARDSGIMVFYCGDNGALYFKEGTNRNDPESCYEIPMWAGIDDWRLPCVPAATRTFAYPGNTYRYDDENDPGLSWAQPYALGVYAICLSIDPTLTEQEIRQLNIDSAFVNSRGMKIINPCEMVARVLERVSKNDDANKLREAYIESLENYDYQYYEDIRIKDNNLLSLYQTNIEITNINGKKEVVTFDKISYDYEAQNENEVSYRIELGNLGDSFVKITSFTYKIDENDVYHFSFNIIATSEMNVAVGDNPSATIFQYFFSPITAYVEKNYSFTITKEQLIELNKLKDASFGLGVWTSSDNSANFNVFLKQFDLDTSN